MAADKSPSKGGRPTIYKPEYADQALQLARLGATDKEMAGFFGVAESTFHKWKIDFPEFSESLKEGKLLSDARVSQALYTRATGYELNDKHYPPDTTACIFWLKNRQPDKWRDKPDDGQSSDSLVDVLKEVFSRLPD